MHHSLHSTVLRLARLLIAASLLLSLSITATAAAPLSGTVGQAELVKDIQNMNGWSAPSRYVPVGDAFYFDAREADQSIHWWRSEGTAETTTMVEELVPGPEGSNFTILTALDDTQFILFTSQQNAYSLWVSDGTAAGTTKLGQFEGGFYNPYTSTEVVRLDGVLYLYFAEMFLRTDGTEAGTERVTEMPLTDQRLGAFNGWLYFAAQGPNGSELYRINNATPGPALVIDMCPEGVNCGNQPGNANPGGFAAGANRLYFVASSPEQGRAIWSTTGTEQSVTLVADFSTDLNGPDGYGGLTPVGSGLYFVGSDGLTGGELWYTLGTPQSTHQVADLAPGPSDGGIGEMIVQGSTLFLTARPVFPGPYNLYKTNGSGLEKLNDAYSYASGFIRVGNEIFFFAYTPLSGKEELWKITESGDLTRVTSVTPFYFMVSRAAWKGNLLFTAGDSIHGYEPWMSNGTAEGTKMLADIRTEANYDGVYSDSTKVMAVYKGNLYFEGQRGLNENGLWRSDGTEIGTEHVAPINDYIEWYSKSQMTVSNDLLYFSANSQLWRTDGTEQGTLQIPDIYTDQMISAGDRLFFNGSNMAVSKSGIWSLSKGESAPTILSEGNVIHMGALGTEVLFVKWDMTLGIWELWRTDGTPAGTSRIYGPVAATTEYLFYPFPRFDQMVAFDNRLFFLAPLAEGSYPLVLYATDGETVTPITSATGEPRFPSNLLVSGDSLYFSGMNGTDSVLWRLSKGSNAAQVVYTTATNVSDYNSAEIPILLADLEGKLVFSVKEPESGRRMLWLSDGTPAGTAPICPGCGYKGPGYAQVVVTEGKLYFPAYHPAHGSELWVSDGTDEGTRILAEVVPGPTGASPAALTKLGRWLIFIADDGEHGEELWRYDLSPLDKPIYLPLIKH